MTKIKAIKYTEGICFHCLREFNKEDIEIFSFGPLGYGSGFDDCSTEIHLCKECLKNAPESLKNQEIEYEDEWMASYKNEDEIFNYFETLPPAGQQFVKNEFWSDSFQMDPQDWLDYFINKDLSYKKAKEYGLYALEEINAYKERFPKCEWTANRLFDDGSCGSYCPFGANGKKDGVIDLNTSQECYQCPYFKERTSEIKTINDSVWYQYIEKLRMHAINNKPNEMELIILPNYGLNQFPKSLKDSYKKNREDMILRNRRGAVIEDLKSIAIKIHSLNDIEYKDLLTLINDKQEIVYIEDSDKYCYFDEYIKNPSYIKIVKVDTNRKWTISEYDGVEEIEYLDYIVDYETGYCKRK